MKMFLTRMVFNSKVEVTGDVTQVDLPPGQKSGLGDVRKVLRGMSDLRFVDLDARDVVRNGLVQQIIRAYEEYDRKKRNK